MKINVRSFLLTWQFNHSLLNYCGAHFEDLATWERDAVVLVLERLGFLQLNPHWRFCAWTLVFRQKIIWLQTLNLLGLPDNSFLQHAPQSEILVSYPTNLAYFPKLLIQLSEVTVSPGHLPLGVKDRLHLYKIVLYDILGFY